MQNKYLHNFTGRVFLEDTDSLGIVYYSKYLNFAERARNEYLRSAGLSHLELQKKFHLSFVVRACSIKYHMPLAFDDIFLVTSSLLKLSPLTISMQQIIYKINPEINLSPNNVNQKNPDSKQKITSLMTELACINENRKPHKPPEQLIKILKNL